jgi:hypothetical protein
MIPFSKSAIVFAAVSTTSAQTNSGYLDTKGYDFVTIDVCSMTGSTNTLAVLTLKEGDTTSSYTTVKAAGTAFTAAAGVTTTPVTNAVICATFRVDMRGRKRYLAVDASPTTTAILWANAHLYRGDVDAVGVSAQGAANLVDV